MTRAHTPGRRPSGRRLRSSLVRTSAAVLAAAATALAGPLALPSGAATSAEEASTSAAAGSSDITMITANIKSSLSVERFQSDVREVLENRPDFVAYNEVPLRVDTVLAPEGYDIYRSRKNRYTAATPVVWRSDRWTMVDSGTFRISNHRDVPRGRNIRLGLRFANWATLNSKDGRTVSVVAAHVAPLDRDMPDLLRPSVRRIGKLVGLLSPAGPVLVGGDFNVHYKSGRYPRDLVGDAAMVPTYDTMGNYFPTGDHQGATIDYVFNRGKNTLATVRHRSVEMHSDHDAIVAGLDWQVDSPAETERFSSDPGDESEKRRVVEALGAAVAATAPGESIDVVTSSLALRSVARKLRVAMKRGVDVRYVTRSSQLTHREKGLVRVAEAVGGGSSVRQCREDCLRSWRRSDMARTFVMLRDSQGRALTRIDANRNLNAAMLLMRTTMVLRTGDLGLARGEEQLTAIR